MYSMTGTLFLIQYKTIYAASTKKFKKWKILVGIRRIFDGLNEKRAVVCFADFENSQN